MSTEFQLDASTCHNGKELEYSSLNGIDRSGWGLNVVHKILDGIRRKGSWSISNTATTLEHRSTSDRYARGNRGALNSVHFLVKGDEKREHGVRRKAGPLLSGTAYCISSCSMILLNKVILSSYAFNAGISLMFYQNFISSLIVVVLGICGAVSVEKLNWKLIKVWIPVNVIFIGMLVSGMHSLKYINIAMVTILKNVTNILTAIGELYIFRKHQNQKVWTAMFLMIISAISGGITDLSFDAIGYAWQITNCILTASYSLTLRWVMDKAKHLTKSGSLNEKDKHLASVVHVSAVSTCSDVTRMPMFWAVATASGLLGLAISFTSMWFLNQTGPTTYSLVGSLNKIPIAVAGIVLFKAPLNLPNFFSILFGNKKNHNFRCQFPDMLFIIPCMNSWRLPGLFAGVFFARAKMS